MHFRSPVSTRAGKYVNYIVMEGMAQNVSQDLDEEAISHHSPYMSAQTRTHGCDSNLIRVATHFADNIQFVTAIHASQKSASFADAQESRLRASLVSFSPISSGRIVSDSRIGLVPKSLTRLSNMHLFSGRSTLRQFHSCWLLFSRHSQCLRNSVKQCLFMSSILHAPTVSYL